MRNAHQLLLWDVLLAFGLWQAVFVFQAVVGLRVLAVPSARELISVMPLVVIWVGIRLGMGFYPAIYPGCGLNTMTELRGHAFAIVVTATIIMTTQSSPQSQIPHLLISLPGLFLWALGLLVAAPVVRHYVKTSLLRNGR